MNLCISLDENLTKIEYKKWSTTTKYFCKDDKIIKIKDLDKLDVDLVVDGDHGFPYKSQEKLQT